MNKIVMGLLWTVVFYFAACMLIGGFIGFEIGRRESNRAVAEAKVKSTVGRVIRSNQALIATGALTCAFMGCFVGFLPGTRTG